MKLFSAILVAVIGCAATREYSNSWAVEVFDGRERADLLAKKYDFDNEGQVGNFENIYHFKLPEYLYSEKDLGEIGEPVYTLTNSLKEEEGVGLAEQQEMKKYVKRAFNLPTDPLWNQQWSLLNTGQIAPGEAGNDLNVVPAWIQGVTGCNSVVAIVDDGVEFTHDDLRVNYNRDIDFDYFSTPNDNNPFPGLDISGMRCSHGTNVAGVIGMAKDNGKCGVGVAYHSTITGIRIFDEFEGSTDMAIAQAQKHLCNCIDIYSNSWGPSDDGMTVEGPGAVTRMAFKAGSRECRAGKGAIWVWAAGNGGRPGVEDSCAADGYINSIYTIAIGAARSDGSHAVYDERCSAKMAVTLMESDTLDTTTTNVLNTCTSTFDGTSAATPLASGTIALVLEVNRGLTWRDVQYLVVYTSNLGILVGGNVATNAAGLQFSHQFGFGAIDAEAMVTRARRWINVPEQLTESYNPTVTMGTADTTDSFSTTFNVIDPSIGHLEHVVVTMTIMGGIALSFRGDTAVLLTSPSGTVSTILPLRPVDLDTIEGYQSWPFMSVHFWSEDPVGNWSLDVHHFNFGSVSVSDMTMTLYGTADVPAAVGRIPFTCDLACARGCAAAGPEFCDACAILRNAETLECITECPFGFIEQNGYCYDPSLPEPQCNSASWGGDPHFSILLHDNNLLCYSVQGKSNSIFNLVSCDGFIVNAKFIPDSKKKGVTWMGSIGVIIHKALRYGGSRVTHFKFDARDHSINIGSTITLKVNTVKELVSNNGSLSIVERDHPTSSPHHSAVKVLLNDVGLHFTIMFEKEHLDMKWHSSVKDSNAHGLIGQFFRRGVEIDEVRKLLVLPNKDPVPVEWKPVWKFMEKEKPDEGSGQHCWVSMNPGKQGKGLIDGHYLDYQVENVLSSGFQFEPSTKN